MDAFVCMNDEFCANEEEDSECRRVREKTVSWELRQTEREKSELRVASLASLAIKKIVQNVTLQSLLNEFSSFNFK